MKVMSSMALVLALAGSAAHADVLIDFEDLAIGQSPGTTYQSQYGITFGGGTVQEIRGNKVLSGSFSISFAPHTDLSSATLQGAQWRDGYNWVTYASGFTETQYHDQTTNPLCSTPENCTQRGYIYIAPDQLFPYRFSVNNVGIDPLVKIDLMTNYADNILFVSPTWVGNAVGNPSDPLGTVPLPGTLALIGVGALAMRRRKSV
jgi:MYXO-CTERM domain-containing protein